MDLKTFVATLTPETLIVTWALLAMGAFALYAWGRRNGRELPRLRRRGTCAGCHRAIWLGEEFKYFQRRFFHNDACLTDFRLYERLEAIHNAEARGRVA